jgi:hypothetical protein
MFTLFGWSGQHMYNFLDRKNSDEIRRAEEIKTRKQREEEEAKNLNWMQRLAKKKWAPFSVLTDEQYEKMLHERILDVEAQIALIDDRIEEFRKLQRQLEKEAVVGKTQEQEKK